MRTITIEGLTPDEILGLPKEHFDQLIFTGDPIVFRAGTAEVLGEFAIEHSTLVMELAHIDGGGEGVLPVLWKLAERYAQTNGYVQVDWRVHAVNCPKPNPKLRRLLEKRGFVIEEIRPGVPVYRHVYVVENI
ncbi:hypothetical protein [Roseimicrobium sp. ORNL1]|uniref:hypothetical protein n=1 Tax=Roseimicrobium sp. ORNL1 TaxID=2711231 RepID=UPI0013E1E73A|nr:hypothetical protein [Roseimicrobium sp. ORNL1]QIF04627.1 hypothetical protein G5S37_24895 [Roseimicrobium sp. ORNL1]